MGEIPVLEVDGERLTQTAPILLMLAKQFGRFGGETEPEQFELLRWLFWDNHKLTGYMATYRFKPDVSRRRLNEHVQKHYPQAHRRLSVDPRTAHAGRVHSRSAHGRRWLTSR